MPYPHHAQSVSPAAVQARLRAEILDLALSAFDGINGLRITFRIVSMTKNNNYNETNNNNFPAQGVQAILTKARWYGGSTLLAKGASVAIGEEGQDVFTVALRALRYAVWVEDERRYYGEDYRWAKREKAKEDHLSRFSADGDPIGQGIRVIRRSSSSIINGRF